MEKERGYQRHPRFTKRLEVTFRSGEFNYRGILSNISENGIFIRTNRGLAPGTTLDIELLLPERKVSFLKGIVRRTIKTPFSNMKNGMGVELTDKDSLFMNFVKQIQEDSADTPTEEKQEELDSMQESHIVPCPNCGVKNRIPSAKMNLGPKCGKCGTTLSTILL
jgi:hypothetical protein